jgi:type IV pilus assembly protein PilE
MQTRNHNAAAAGFTLVELMITVAIVGILATIAATSYQSQVQKSRRTDARSALLDIAGREEKLFSTTNAYSQVATELGYSTLTPVGNGYYHVTLQANTAAVPPTYLLTATPMGVQANDSTCLTLTLDQTGAQGSTGSGTAATCWGH